MSALAIGLEIASTLLGPLVSEIAAGIESGLDEHAATEKALERMRATPLPDALRPKLRAMIADARASPKDAAPAMLPEDARALRRLLRSSHTGHEDAAALMRVLEAHGHGVVP